MLDILLSQTASGLVLGGLYVLIAIGLSIIFGLLGIVNFAHGAFFTLGAYLALTLVQLFGWPAVVLAPVIFGGIGQPFSPPPFMAGVFLWGPVLITKYRVGVLVTTALVLLLLWLFLEKTRFGRILRAGSRDPEMVGLLGINLPRVLTWVFGLGCAISGIAGLLAAPLWTVTPAMATNAIMPAFVVVAIGGLGSFAGAVIAGLLVGVVVALTIQFKPEASGAVMYLFMALMLLLRPRGLLGERWERFE